jgi:anaerobic C4-dicarboxylate transporter
MINIFKKPTTGNSLIFISGIEISACVNLLTGIYYATLSTESLIFVVISSTLLAIAGFLSILLGNEVQTVMRIAESAKETTLEMYTDKLMEDELEKKTHLFLHFYITKGRKMTIVLFLNLILALSALALAITERLIGHP